MSTQPAATGSNIARIIYYLIGLIGTVLLLVGVFMPAISRVLEDRERVYIEYFVPEGILLLLCVAASLFLMKRRELRRLVIIGVLAISVLTFSYLRNEQQKSARINEAYGWVYKDKEPDPAMRERNRGGRKATADLIRSFEEGERYKAGWGVMIIGSVLLLGAGLLTYSSVEQGVLNTFALFEPSKKKCPSCAGLNAVEALKCKHCGEPIG
jgi:hypothetical protein